MLGLWFDYSQGRPSGAALKAAGARGVMRYVGVGGSSTLPAKRLTAGELADLTGHGLIVLGAVESSTTRSNGGRAQGVADGKAALADPVTKKLPVLFATNDQPAWSQANVDYVAGFQSIVGKARTGVYGFGAFLTACSKAGLGSVYWQAGPSPSRTGTTGLVHFWQRQGGAVQASDGPTSPTLVTVAGVPCDPDNQLKELPTMTTPADFWSADPTDPAVTGGGKMGHELEHVRQLADNTDYGFAALAAKVDGLGKQVTGALTKQEADLLAAIQAGAQHVDVTLSDEQIASLATPITNQLAGLPAAVRQAIGTALVGDQS